MSGISVELVAAELQRFVTQNKSVVQADFARALNVPIDEHCRKVTKIKGAYQVMHSLMTHVIQGFKSEWQELGTLSIKDKELRNYHQKINFGFVPADILATPLADWYEEDKKPTDKMIAKEILKWLFVQANDDLSLLSMTGVYDSVNASGQFGYSLNGFNKLVADLLANTDRPCFKVPVSAFTSTNIVEEVRNFEVGLPKMFKNKIKKIHMSETNKELYEIDYFNSYGMFPSFKDDDKTRSPLRKREIVGHADMADTVMFATVDDNMLNLIDVIDNPATITDVQTQDYKVKIFGECWKGWDFLINEAVCVANFADGTRGLGNAAKNELYYPHENIIVA